MSEKCFEGEKCYMSSGQIILAPDSGKPLIDANNNSLWGKAE